MLNLNCVICAELFSPSDVVHITTCGHMFHIFCLEQWLERSKTCPQCRNKCTLRNHFRVYFNLANLDVSRVDVASLQEQLDNSTLQCKMKEKELHKAQDQVKGLKDIQKKCMKTIAGLEQKAQKNDFLLLSYNEQIRQLKFDMEVTDSLRKEVKTLKQQIETMEGVSKLLTSTDADSKDLLKNENDPKKLAVWVATLKRELRQCENKKTDMRNVLRVVQNDLRKEIELKRLKDEHISRLESENYELNEKVRAMEAAKKEIAPTACSSNQTLLALMEEARRATISPLTKENVRKIEESDSPYFNIKSSSVGLVPLLKANRTVDAKITSSAKMKLLKVSPVKNIAENTGAVRKTQSDLSERYSIFKKPRLGMVTAVASVGAARLSKPLGPNFVFNGFGGSERIDPFAANEEIAENADLEDEDARRARKIAAKKASACNLNKRLKTGSLRNFQITK